MKEKIKIFLESDLLEKYLLGATSREEAARVERYIVMYPEVRKQFEELQENLEAYAKLHSRPSPEGLKARILQRIRKEDRGRRKIRRYAIAASVAAFLFAGSSYFFWNQNQNLQDENTLVNNRIQNLEADMKQQLEDVRNQFIVLNNPQTKKFYVNGNEKARDLKAVAYVNPVKKLSYINVRNLPNLPEDQCYQMWAEVNGEMVNLGIIKKIEDKDKLLALPYGENAISYITIEPDGGNVSPTVQNIVANISY
ncbi:Anti-sigma-K factor rskA [Muriicola jejuensis]|uniref:Regulator of SigK n=1 Tax=Muriicola jejuensis TaxID=504488 RepID=A0A6P0UBK1_9FLAO|nr:anti-sigma factor [Muriicola jejuensis]NER09259.1 RNA polymerase subunit sigma-70 [Muriicola jejuensis]SMP09936.1 Anti-sigma-K factor rskA [Muriicola jejuensis]